MDAEREQRIMTRLQADFPVPDQRDLATYMERLHRMKNFYDDKAPNTTTKSQGEMFVGFSLALQFAIETLDKYDELTKELEKSATIKP